MQKTLVDSMTAELGKTSNLSDDFKAQLARFKEFKDKLDKAGVSYGDKYEIPLMSRIQSNSK